MVQRGRPQRSDFANGNGRNRRDPDTETGQNAGIFRGTEGSNPVSSSGESRANLISSIRALKFAKRDGVTRRYAAWFGAESVPAGSLAND